MQLRLNTPLAFFDLEATGTHVVHDRIIEIAIVKLMPNGEQFTYEKRINPEILIPEGASLIHGIYDVDVKNLPNFRQIAKELLQFLQGCDLAGFNILRFDIPLLIESFLRAEMDFELSTRKIIDVQKLFHLMEKRTLMAAYQFYCQKELQRGHSAMADTLATMEVLIAQVKKYEHQEVKDTIGNMLGTVENNMKILDALTTSTMVDLAGRMVYNANKVPVFNFGKHKGKLVAEILKKDPSYYSWMMQGDFPLDTKRKLTQIKLGTIQ